jgi:hypothetical protein
MYVFCTHLVVQSTLYPLRCDCLDEQSRFVSAFTCTDLRFLLSSCNVSSYFLGSAKWLFCGTEIRYICTHHRSCDRLGLYDVTAVRSDIDMKVCVVLQIDML